MPPSPLLNAGPGTAAALLAPLEQRGIRLGLDAIRRLLGQLGAPHLAAPSVLVAGTNGKGSTSALLAAMASAAGYRTGLYTSPHLERVEERVRIDGRWVAEQELAEALRELLEIEESPTYFEALTAAAFLIFARRRVELMILEVGLGGRLDATNVADPLLSAVTTIGVDHAEYLGNTLGEIAREKAGIFRRGRPAIWGPQPAAARAALLVEAEARGVEAEEVVQPFALELRLAGAHQRHNAALAARAAALLRDLGFPRLDPSAIARGAAGCFWPGRLERVALDEGRHALLDGAHNPAGVETLCAYLDERGEPFDLLFGVMADKDAGAMLAPLAARAGRIVLTTAPNPRATSAEALAALLKPSGDLVVEPDFARALAVALALTPRRLLVVSGSLYLVGAARTWLRQRFGRPAPAETLFEGLS